GVERRRSHRAPIVSIPSPSGHVESLGQSRRHSVPVLRRVSIPLHRGMSRVRSRRRVQREPSYAPVSIPSSSGHVETASPFVRSGDQGGNPPLGEAHPLSHRGVFTSRGTTGKTSSCFNPLFIGAFH